MTRSLRRGDTWHMRNPTMCQRAPRLCTRGVSVGACVYGCLCPLLFCLCLAAQCLSASVFVSVSVVRTISTALESRSPCPRPAPAGPPDRIHPSDATPRLMMQTDHRQQHTYTHKHTQQQRHQQRRRRQQIVSTHTYRGTACRHSSTRRVWLITLPALCGLLCVLR
eukprot:COSAG06_NODE_12598_length_1358_cov_1.138205_2_plen_166_part_00